MKMTRSQKIGRLGEKLAEKFLVGKGYEIIGTNWHCRGGEIDLVVRKNETFVFVEVKCRSHSSYGNPAEWIDASKKKKFFRAIAFYLNQGPLIKRWQADVILIDLVAGNRKAIILHIENIDFLT